MGTEITREKFSERDYVRFAERLERCLSDLGHLLGRPGFGAGPVTIGAELELFLVDGAARPLPLNQAVRALAADPRVALELNRFNLELNSSPALLAGRPFTALAGELGVLLDRVGAAARAHHGRIALIGVLPTLSQAHLGAGAVTGTARYRALDRGLRRLRRGPLQIKISGAEPLELTSEVIALEGANCSFQMHLRVAPGDFSRVYNAVQLATAPALAVAGNSPTFLGHRLWEETRVALFKQSVEDRDSRGPRRRPAAHHARHRLAARRSARAVHRERPAARAAAALRQRPPGRCLPGRCLPGRRLPGRPAPQSCDPPGLDELRLHQGTVWRWNRAIYDPTAGGHLRIEMRALPAGPTVTDMLANAAFLVGLTLWLAGQDQRWTYGLPFERADHGFYRAAQYGLAAELTWPSGPHQVRTVTAAALVPELLPAARDGLVGAGVAEAEADHLLGVIGARVATGQTGAAWQRAALAAAEPGRSREQALRVMLDRYLACAATGQPAHTWPTPGRNL